MGGCGRMGASVRAAQVRDKHDRGASEAGPVRTCVLGSEPGLSLYGCRQTEPETLEEV